MSDIQFWALVAFISFAPSTPYLLRGSVGTFALVTVLLHLILGAP